jgi:hypothetical protein
MHAHAHVTMPPCGRKWVVVMMMAMIVVEAMM